MPSPFPGMDPYLEDDTLWPAFQHQLVNVPVPDPPARLVDRYRARVGQRLYMHRASPVYVDRPRRAPGRIHRDSPAQRRPAGHPPGRRSARRTRPPAGPAGLSEKRREAGPAAATWSRSTWSCRASRRWITRARDCPTGITRSPSRVPPSRSATRSTRQRCKNGCHAFACPWQPMTATPSLDLHTAFTRCYDQGGFAAKIDYSKRPRRPPQRRRSCLAPRCAQAAQVC